MSNIAIKVENLSKRYRIGLKEEINDTFFATLSSWVKFPLSNFRRLQKLSNFNESNDSEDIIWALKDISFELNQGEVLGIIGKNGAGKSTLLKILCRITEPSSGKASINGRVASLLEVGTGFHPELTGRENVFLNGAILGMTKTEIERKFDEIVDFSGVEKFIDTPVKRYSSGMRVRLAFAVAAQLEPEILLIDEVLAVGDIAFQKKCLGKMESVSKSGRTVFFVSHNMAAVSSICSKAILLEQGRLVELGDTDQIIAQYMKNNSEISKIPLHQRKDRGGNGNLKFSAISILNLNGDYLEHVVSGQDVIISLTYHLRASCTGNVTFGVNFEGFLGQQMFQCRSNLVGKTYKDLPNDGEIKCRVPKLPLPPGEYRLLVWAKDGRDFLDVIEGAMTLSVHPGDYFGSGKLPSQNFRGVLIQHTWHPAQQIQPKVSDINLQ